MQSFEFRFIWGGRKDSCFSISSKMVTSVQRDKRSVFTFHGGLATQGSTGNAKAVIGTRQRVCGANFCRQKLLDFLARGFGEGGLRLTIHAENLLAHGVRPASEEARLGWRGPAFYSRNSGNVHTFAAEIFKKRVALDVLANGSDGKHARSQVGQVVRGVGSSAGDDLGLAVAQNQHRRLARDAGNVAELKFVGDKIAEQNDRLGGKLLDALRQGKQVHGGRRRLC